MTLQLAEAALAQEFEMTLQLEAESMAPLTQRRVGRGRRLLNQYRMLR